MAALGDEQVCGLDVAMNDPLGVRSVQSFGNFNCQAEQKVSIDGFSGDAGV